MDYKPVTAEELAEIGRLDHEATPGPWAYDEEDDVIETARGSSVAVLTRAARPDLARVKPDGCAIAAYRTAAPRLARDLAAERTRFAHAHDAADRLYRAAVHLRDGIDDDKTALSKLLAAIDPAESDACASEAARRDGLEREIERLTAELAARAPAEGRVRYVLVCRDCGAKVTAGQSCKAAGCPPRAPADASLEARAEALGRIVRAAWVEVAKKEAKTVPGYVDLWEWLEIPDADTDREIGEQVVRAVDASRPGLTEEQAPGPQALWAVAEGARHLRAIYGTHAHAGVVNEAADTLVQWMSLLAADAQRASRGETGPAPTGLTSAMHAAQQRRSVPPRIEYEHGPDGETYRPDPISLGERGPWDEEDEGQ